MKIREYVWAIPVYIMRSSTYYNTKCICSLTTLWSMDYGYITLLREIYAVILLLHLCFQSDIELPFFSIDDMHHEMKLCRFFHFILSTRLES